MTWLDGHSPTIVFGACYLGLIVVALLLRALFALAALMKGGGDV